MKYLVTELFWNDKPVLFPIFFYAVFLRIPSLERVITYDTEQHPGSFLFSDVLDMGRSEHYDVIEECKKTLQFDDVMNIQFTSVSTDHLFRIQAIRARPFCCCFFACRNIFSSVTCRIS